MVDMERSIVHEECFVHVTVIMKLCSVRAGIEGDFVDAELIVGNGTGDFESDGAAFDVDHRTLAGLEDDGFVFEGVLEEGICPHLIAPVRKADRAFVGSFCQCLAQCYADG